MRERLGALPLGELHAEGVCAYCGAQGYMAEWREASVTDPLRPLMKRTVHPMTLAIAHVCVDTVACERRRYKAKL